VRGGDAIAVVGPFEPSLAGSELAKLRGLPHTGPLPTIDPTAVRAAHEAVREGIRTAVLHSAHDISDGGLAVALAECCIAGWIGAKVQLPDGIDLFAEAPGQAFLVSGPASALARFTVIGQVGGDELEVTGHLKLAVSAMRDAYDRSLAKVLKTPC
jgi:phosphoribosylformylglycinamidine (FGAM) synthase-like enzyme